MKSPMDFDDGEGSSGDDFEKDADYKASGRHESSRSRSALRIHSPRTPARPPLPPHATEHKLPAIGSIPNYLPHLLTSCSGLPASTQGSRSTLIIDNGAYYSKFGLSDSPQCRIIPNFVGKPKTGKKRYVGEDISQCKDFSALYQLRPHDKGFLMNWELQREIWGCEQYFKTKLNREFKPQELDLLLTSPPMTPDSLLRNMHEQVFEEMQFCSLFLCSPQFLALQHALAVNPELASSPCHVIVDCGYSFCHIVPFFNGVPINHAIQRVNVGGKVLTNYLKEVVSYRYYNMMDETYLVNIIKEKLCYVSSDYMRDLAICQQDEENNTLNVYYLLPDYVTSTEGYVISKEEKERIKRENKASYILEMNNERIAVPEVLFNPSDIGLHQCGIPEAIANAISKAPEEIREFLYRNIYVVGGSTKFSGFIGRLEQELRMLAPNEYEVKVYHADDPITSAWEGGVNFVRTNPRYGEYFVTREQFEEFGDFICLKKFSWLL